MLILTISGTFLYAATISVIARLFTYAATCAALPVLRRRTDAPTVAFQNARGADGLHRFPAAHRLAAFQQHGASGARFGDSRRTRSFDLRQFYSKEACEPCGPVTDSLFVLAEVVYDFNVGLLVVAGVSVRLRQRHRIFGGHLVFQELTAPNRPDSLDQVQRFAVWSAGIVEPRAGVESRSVHHQSIAIPAADGVSEPLRLRGWALRIRVRRRRQPYARASYK